jgi:hypothetical protein
VYKGIPDRWRMAAWWTLAEEATQRYTGKGKCKRSAEALAVDYRVSLLPSTNTQNPAEKRSKASTNPPPSTFRST